MTGRNSARLSSWRQNTIASSLSSKEWAAKHKKARELEVAVLGNDDPKASVAGEIIPGKEFYDYEAKYLSEGSVPVIQPS